MVKQLNINYNQKLNKYFISSNGDVLKDNKDRIMWFETKSDIHQYIYNIRMFFNIDKAININ